MPYPVSPFVLSRFKPAPYEGFPSIGAAPLNFMPLALLARSPPAS
ncbi:hypothetical protein PA57_03335 [Pseudomonas aeruginosa]|nr:hypothetical protein PA57_03335 [Pseudomonas aeruginosa]SQC49901.1 Uncharacterised protein [Pseudomonas aeruginosa]